LKAEQENAQIYLIEKGMELPPFSEVFTEKIIHWINNTMPLFVAFATCHAVQASYIYSIVMRMQLSTSLV
jgi:hypothetical protein